VHGDARVRSQGGEPAAQFEPGGDVRQLRRRVGDLPGAGARLRQDRRVVPLRRREAEVAHALGLVGSAADDDDAPVGRELGQQAEE